uniref:Uncharacterized protein TCIL3000_7_350 n=1 Tax=Trypanosoma congolense (strain IL3000) TaxID=1068625 RepID=G0UPC5_TRYCI|nr:unnamed protein product [Trypanosoma congolense IL3000]
MDAAREDAEMLPLHYRIAGKADALDAELRRLSFVLFEKPQLVVDLRPATLTRRPANVTKVLQHFGLNSLSSRGLQKRPAEWTPPVGSASPFVQLCSSLCRFMMRRCHGGAAQTQAPPGGQLVTLTADLDYLRRMKEMHALNFYSRMNMTPRRHIWLALYTTAWNAVVSVQNALGCVLFGIVRGVKDYGVMKGVLRGSITGCFRASQFLAYGLVLSPIIHIPSGFTNSLYGIYNAFRGKLFFEPGAGRWYYCSVLNSSWLKREMLVETRLIRSVGRMEFHRKNMKGESKWKERLASMGFSFDRMSHNFMGKGRRLKQGNGGCADEMENPYDVLQLKRTATLDQVKSQYRRLAKIFHPDAVQSGGEQERHKARLKFESISHAYQILSNPEKRRSYDLGGSQALRLHESKMGRFMARTPEEVVQGVFGGEGFKHKVLGQLLRSHWHLRNEAQVSVSLHEFEQLQVLRCLQLALELACILDVHADAPPAKEGQKRGGRARSDVAQVLNAALGGKEGTPKREPQPRQKRTTEAPDATGTGSPYELTCYTNEFNCFSRDFMDRCDRYTRRLAEACFGKELMYEVGQSYVISSQRFLGIVPFYAPKMHVYRKIFSGIDRVYDAFREKMDKEAKNNPEWLARKVMVEYFGMEFDAVVADASGVLRFAAQNVLQDVAVAEDHRRRRCYALWYLGHQMMLRGTPWSKSATKRGDDGELMAYIQQAANSAATTTKPDRF